jgi:CheY-like chemotaxis protein
VGHATNGVQALQKARVLQPDLVLLDIAMPEMGGLEVAAQMQAWPQVPTLVFLSMNDNDSYREAARLAGANGFVSKTNFVTDLIPMIEQMVTHKTMKVTAP